MAKVSLVRYEAGHNPRDEVLARLARLARENKAETLADVFQRAIGETSEEFAGEIAYHTDEERELALAFLAVLRNTKYSATLIKIKRLLEAPRAECKHQQEAFQKLGGLERSALTMLNDGFSPDYVKKILCFDLIELNIEKVNEIAIWQRIFNTGRRIGLLNEGEEL